MFPTLHRHLAIALTSHHRNRFIAIAIVFHNSSAMIRYCGWPQQGSVGDRRNWSMSCLRAMRLYYMPDERHAALQLHITHGGLG